LKEIKEDEYLETLDLLVEKKWDSLTEKDLFRKKNKVFQYLIGRGFESDLIQEAMVRHLENR
jgi:regulatory protein